jgi:hypothetical protein
MPTCPMCPAWMGGGMLIATVIGVLLIALLVVAILRLLNRQPHR